MHFTSQTSSDGVSEHLFTLDGIPGVLWSPAAVAVGRRPLVLRFFARHLYDPGR